MTTLVSTPPKAAVVEVQPLPEAEVAALGRFEDEAKVVLSRIRKAFGHLIGALGPVKTAGDVQRALKIDKALSWQLFRLGTVADPIEAGADLPRAVPMGKAMLAGASAGIPAGVLAEAREAYAQFERLVREHAGTRGSFDVMVRGLRSDDAQVHLRERRNAYRSNSSIWGVQALAKLNCLIIHPAEDGQVEDSVLVTGHVGLRKLRPGAQVVIAARSATWEADGSVPSGCGERSAIDRRKVDVLEEFSTRPLPPLATRQPEPGVMETTIEVGNIGNSGELTYFMRDISRAAGRRPQELWGSTSVTRLPAETLVMDMLVPQGWSDAATARVTTYGNLRDCDRAWNRNDADRIPVTEVITYLGRDLDRLQTPLIPRCPELVAHVLGSMGWDRTRFDLYRCVVQYPILHAGVATRVDAGG